MFFYCSLHDQIDEVAMGFPLAPILANIFMGHHGHHEKLLLVTDFQGSTISFYRRLIF